MARNDDNFYNADGTTGFASWGSGAISGVTNILGSFIGSHQQEQILKGQANLANAQNQTQLELARLGFEKAKIEADTALKLVQAKPSSNKGLIIGASIAGVVLIGVTIYAITKK